VKGIDQVAHDSRDGSAVIYLLGLWVWILPQAWWSLSCKCCVLSGRDLCDGLITHPEESYWLLCVWVWSWSLKNEEALAHLGLSRHKKFLSAPCRNVGGSRSIVQLILNLSTIWKRLVSFTLRPLYPWETTPVPNWYTNSYSFCMTSMFCCTFSKRMP